MSASVVASFRDAHEAHLARALLESAGLPAYVVDEHTIGNIWLYSNLLGGVKVLVPADLAAEARSILADGNPPPEPEPNSVPSARPERCPVCSGAVRSLDPTDRRVRALSMLIGFPFAIGRRRRRCDDCGHTWRAPRTARIEEVS
ncbi:MAG TPA: DUF2007 domain-containing protein [Myxococcota bacterium]